MQCLQIFIAEHIAQYGEGYGIEQRNFYLLEQRVREFAEGTCQNGEEDFKGKNQLTLSTVHKAKGLGWKNVFVLQPDDLPLSYVMLYGSDDEQQQELNVKYVAYTRAKQSMCFLRHLPNLHCDRDQRGRIEELFRPAVPTSPCEDEEETTYAGGGGSSSSGGSSSKSSSSSSSPPVVVSAAVTEAFAFFQVPIPSTLTPHTSSHDILGAVEKVFKQKISACHPDKRSLHGLSEDEATAQSQRVIHFRDVIKEFVAVTFLHSLH